MLFNGASPKPVTSQEWFEVEQRIQDFRQFKEKELQRKLMQQQELSAQHKRDMQMKKMMADVAQQREVQQDKLMLQDASAAMAAEQRDVLRRRRLLQDVARQNLQEAQARKMQARMTSTQFQQDVLQLQERYARQQDQREASYEQKLGEIHRKQQERERRFQALFVEPAEKRQHAFDERINKDVRQTALTTTAREAEMNMFRRDARQVLIDSLDQQVQEKRFNQELERMRKQEEQAQRLHSLAEQKTQPVSALDFSAYKFYGVDLPLEVTSPPRFIKTHVKSVSHDPITGAFRQFKRDESPVRTLGAGQPESFPGKILDSVPNASYAGQRGGRQTPRLRNTKRYTSFNPVTHHSQDFSPSGAFASVMQQNHMAAAAPMPTMFEKPIGKGRGYQRSTAFDFLKV